MANTYFIMTADELAGFEATYGTGIKASDYAYVSPVLILSGDYNGCYAVNTAIIDSDPCFEQLRTAFEALPTAELDLEELNNVEEETTEGTDTDTSTETTE